MQGPNLRVESRISVAAAIVILDYAFECGDAAVVHVGRGTSDLAQRGRVLKLPCPPPRSANFPSRQATPVLWSRSSVKLGPTWQATQFALPRKSCKPARCSGESALRSPLTKRSNGESPERMDRT